MNSRAHRTTAVAAVFGIAAAISAAPALAQDADAARQAQPMQQEQPQQAVEVTEEKLEKFVDALSEITVIRQAAAAELESAADMERAEQVHREAQEQMIEAVEGAGLSVDEYNRIATRMGTDQDLSERIHSKLQERG